MLHLTAWVLINRVTQRGNSQQLAHNFSCVGLGLPAWRIAPNARRSPTHNAVGLRRLTQVVRWRQRLGGVPHLARIDGVVARLVAEAAACVVDPLVTMLGAHVIPPVAVTAVVADDDLRRLGVDQRCPRCCTCIADVDSSAACRGRQPVPWQASSPPSVRTTAQSPRQLQTPETKIGSLCPLSCPHKQGPPQTDAARAGTRAERLHRIFMSGRGDAQPAAWTSAMTTPCKGIGTRGDCAFAASAAMFT